MENKNRYLRYIPIAPDIYEGLQEIWSYDLLDYFEHSPREAVVIARRLGAVKVADWIARHPDDYLFGQQNGQWRLAGDFAGEVVCYRFDMNAPGPSALTNVPRSVVHHSPSGHAWAYNGCGPSDLALDILTWYLPPNRKNGRVECWLGVASRKARDWHQQFKVDKIASLPREGGTIGRGEILDWLAYAQKVA